MKYLIDEGLCCNEEIPTDGVFCSKKSKYVAEASRDLGIRKLALAFTSGPVLPLLLLLFVFGDDDRGILLAAELNVDVALLLLDEGQGDDLLTVANADEDRLCGVHSDAGHRPASTADLDMANFCQALRAKSQEITLRRAHEHVSVIVRAVVETSYSTARLKLAQYGLVLLHAVVEH